MTILSKITSEKSDFTNCKLNISTTSAQQAIWLGQQIDKDSPAYNVASYIEIKGEFKYAFLVQALNVVIKEIESLRTFFSNDSGELEALRQFISEIIEIDVSSIDLQGDCLPIDTAHKIMLEELGKPINLEVSPIFTTLFIMLNKDHYYWYFKTHHIAMDGYAMTIFFQRVSEVYTQLAQSTSISKSPFNSLNILIDNESKYQKSKAFLADKSYWKDKCGNIESVCSFKDRSALPTKIALQYNATIPEFYRTGLAELSRKTNTHLSIVLISAFAVFLHRISSQQMIVLGVPFLNRSFEAASGIPASLANVLPLKTLIKQYHTLRQVIETINSQLAEMRRHQRYRSEVIRRDCNLLGENRRLTGPQINIDMFTHELVFANSSGTVQVLNAGAAEDFALLIQLNSKAGLTIAGLANPDLYNQNELQSIVHRFIEFLGKLRLDVDLPVGQFNAFTKADLSFFNQPVSKKVLAPNTQSTLISIFEQRVEEAPSNIAITFEQQQLSYSELNAKANQLAHTIIAKTQNTSEQLVALLLPRSLETIIAIIAVLKVGAAYVPIDPEVPNDRIHSMLSDTNPLLIITNQVNAAEKQSVLSCPKLILDEKETQQEIDKNSAENLNEIINLNSQYLAYIIYTSGSTGKPKGVKITHYNVVRLFTSTDTWFKYSDQDVWTNYHSYIFDASVWEIWGALLHGARLVIVPTNITRDPPALLELVVQEKVTVFGQIPSAFYQFMEAEQMRPDLGSELNLRYQCFGGEALDLNRLKPWFERHPENYPKLLNMYGITETTINLTYQFITKSQCLLNNGSLIGQVYDDSKIMILDDALQPVAPGVYGEIYVAGDCLAQGYLNLPSLDAARFVANPFGVPGSRMYRSGDVARLLDSNVYEYLGRADQQIKIRGYRVELGEIEFHLRNHPAVSDVVASVSLDNNSDASLVAHVVLRSNISRSFDVNELREYLQVYLPAYMVPNAIGVMEKFPTSFAGKVDKKKLPAITMTLKKLSISPNDEFERNILDIWESYLNITNLGMDNNFFDSGGDSIKAIHLCRDLDMPVTELFSNPTPRFCADYLRENSQNSKLKGASLVKLFNKRNMSSNLNLICVPFAGGNSLAFQGLLNELSNEISCYAINLPGHDPIRPDEPLLSINELTLRIVDEITLKIKGPIIIYGHCAGNSLAIEIAQALEAAGAKLIKLIIGGMLLDQNPEITLKNIATKEDIDILAFLQSIGGFKDELDQKTLTAIAKMTKHDSLETANYFAHAAKNMKTLDAPIHVIVGDKDPLTKDYESRYLEWQTYSDMVSLSVIKNAGHYFVTENVNELANILREQCKDLIAPAKGYGSLRLREFCNPFDDETGEFYLLINDHRQYSLWPKYAALPSGWEIVSGPSSRSACLKILEIN